VGLRGGGDAADEVFLLGLGFGTDGEGIEEIEAESEIEGFVLAVAKVALAEDFHADDTFAGGAHLADDADDGIGSGVHVRANGIDTHEIDIDPGRFGGGAKRCDAVAGAAVSANDALLLGFGENVHDAAVAVGPVGFGEAMHEADVDVIGAEFAAETVQVGASGDGVAGPGLGEDGDFVAGHMLEGFGDVRVAAVRICGVEEAQAVIVAVKKQVGETLYAEGGLMRMMAGADRAGAHSETAGLDAGLAEGDGVGSRKFARERGKSEGTQGECGRMEPRGADGASSAMEKFAAFHGTSSGARTEDIYLSWTLEKVFRYQKARRADGISTVTTAAGGRTVLDD
jgi:hypothetical protein